MIFVRIGFRKCLSLSVQVGIVVLVEIDLRIIRNRDGLGDVASQSDHAAGVAVIIALGTRGGLVFFVGGFEENCSASIVRTRLEVERSVVFVLEAVEPAKVVLLVVIRERPPVLVDAR